jgi:hypothetical protein
MLKLRKGKPPFVPVALGGGATIRVRAATQTDVETASAQAQRDLMGLVAGSEAAGVLAAVLGDDFKVGALQTPARTIAAGTRLSEIYLVLACQDGWSGVATEEGDPIAAPDAATIALLLADPMRRIAVLKVVNSTVHVEQAEKNASSASPNGAAGIPAGAPIAGSMASHALSGGPSPTSMVSPSGAQKSSMHQRRRRAAPLPT